MTIVVQSAAWRMAQASRHPEVNQESPTRLEPNNQILAAALERRDTLAFELAGDGTRLEWPDDPWIRDADPVEATAENVRREPETDRLDLRQLGHSPSLALGPTCSTASDSGDGLEDDRRLLGGVSPSS